MLITLEDIEGMASPSGSGDWEDEGFEEIVYDGRGRREGMSTVEICDRLKSAYVSKFEREFSVILKTYPKNGQDLKVLLWLANGFSYAATAAGLGRCYKTIKNTARRLRQFRDYGTVKLLPADQVLAGDALTAPFPRSNAGRKPAGEKKITTAAIIIGFDLFGNPVQARARKTRKPAPRVRVRRACPGQLELGQLELFGLQEAA
jgi:hypothetical protein